MDISVLLNQMITLFLMMFLGYFLYKVNILNETFNKQITVLILQVTTPCLILSSVLDDSAALSPSAVAETFIVAILFYLLLPLISKLITFIIRAPKQQQGIYNFAGTYGNVGYMGFPIIASLLGSSALLLTAIFNIMFNLSAFSIGVFTITKGTGKQVEFSPKSLLTPGILLSTASILVYLLGIRFPYPVEQAVYSVGQLTTPLAMIMIGSTLATMKVREVINDKRVYFYTLIHQILLPLLLFPVMKLLIQSELLLAVSFVLFIMPAGNITVLFATNYDLDAKLDARIVFITTLLSLVTVPLLLYICMGS